MNVALILKELRTLKKASQQQIADKLNIERSTYSKWESGQVMLRVDQLQKLANLYGIDFEYMARCIQVGKLVSPKDTERFIRQQELKELRLEGGGVRFTFCLPFLYLWFGIRLRLVRDRLTFSIPILYLLFTYPLPLLYLFYTSAIPKWYRKSLFEPKKRYSW